MSEIRVSLEKDAFLEFTLEFERNRKMGTTDDVYAQTSIKTI